MIITFIGHRFIHDSALISKKLEEHILSIISPTDNVYFYCGGYGQFDNLCASVCISIKKKHKNCQTVLITPYITESYQRKLNLFLSENIYDSIIYPPLECVPQRFAIVKRNEWMINQADLVIAYVKNGYGGAYKSLEYAKRKKKKIINLAT